LNSSYRLLVVDIDGTLINKDGAISAEDRDALARVAGSGVRLSLSTGRVAKACLKVISQLSLDGCHIFFDGALVSNIENGEEVDVRPISKSQVRQVIDYVRRNEMDIDLYSATRYFVRRETWATEIRRQFFGLEPTVVDFSELWREERIIKGTLVTSSAEERAKVDGFYRRFEGSLSFSRTTTPAYPNVYFDNVINRGVSKGKALEALASYLGIPLAEVMVIGDGLNDVSLLSVAGLAVAMGNAPDELKAVADHVTLDIDHSGVAAAVSKFLL
jgi:Cof subfamily protein (haloacid dehalogenase superfamily)